MEEVSVYKQIAERVIETLIKEIATAVQDRMKLMGKLSYSSDMTEGNIIQIIHEQFPELIKRWWNEFKDSGYFHEAVRLSIWGEESDTVKRMVRSGITDWWLEFRTSREFKEWVQALQTPTASDEYIRDEVQREVRKILGKLSEDL